MCSWSIGVLMYSMLCGTLPFNSPTQIIYDDLPKNTATFKSPSAFTFLRQCLDKNNAHRIKIQDMLLAPWFQESLT
jgi:serine/threonine protein kinase